VANKIILKNSNVADAEPDTSECTIGEIVCNRRDNTLFIGSGSGTAGDTSDSVALVGAPILDQDDMSSDSAKSLVTQQSIKSYVDNKFQWIQFGSCKYSMTDAGSWYLGTKKVTSDATVTYDDIVPSMFEQSDLPILQNCGDTDATVHRFRYFFVYDGSTSTDDLAINIYKMEGNGVTSDNEFHGATALASIGGLTLSHTITLTNLNDDMWHHYSSGFNVPLSGTITLEPGAIILPLIESSASTRKSIYLNCAYQVSGMGGDY